MSHSRVEPKGFWHFNKKPVFYRVIRPHMKTRMKCVTKHTFACYVTKSVLRLYVDVRLLIKSNGEENYDNV